MNKWLKQIRVKAILPAAALLAAAAIGTTFAWQQWDLSVTNELKAHETKVEVEEEFNKDENTKTDVKFKNNGTSSVFVRVSCTQYWEKKDSDGKHILSNTYKGADGVVHSYANLNGLASTTDWFKGKDGWYYYLYPLKSGDSTKNFLNNVTFDSKCDTDPDHSPENYHLYFKVEAVQCSDGSNTLNSDEVNAHATYKVFGSRYWAGTRKPDADGKIEWKDGIEAMPSGWKPIPDKSTSSSSPAGS